MTQYIIKRLLVAIPTLWIVFTLTFVVMRLTPGGPWDNVPGDTPLAPAVIENIRARYGVDQPIWKQYITYIGNALKGDLGVSYIQRGRSATEIVRTFLPVSLQLGAVAMVLGIVGGLSLGLLAAVKHNTVVDYLAMLIAVIGVSVPSYVTASFLIVILSITLGWLPAGGWNGVFDTRIIIPSVALAAFPMATIARYTRASTLEVLRQPYVVTARAKGLRYQTVVLRHVLKNALIPVITVAGLTFVGIMTGSFFVETVVGIPGIGRYFVTAASGRDYPVLMAVTMVYAILLILINIIVDVIYAVLDPRIRY